VVPTELWLGRQGRVEDHDQPAIRDSSDERPGSFEQMNDMQSEERAVMEMAKVPALLTIFQLLRHVWVEGASLLGPAHFFAPAEWKELDGLRMSPLGRPFMAALSD